MEHRESERGDAREASAQPIVVTVAETAPVGRRDLAALVGALAGLAATGCLNEAGGSEAIENLGSIAQAATTGTSLRWVDTVLGIAPIEAAPLPPGTPPNPARPGDLATNNSANLGNAGVVIAKGCVKAGDGGWGIFYWDGGSTETDDGGTVIAPSAGGGRWRRIFSGDVNVKWFGAIGNVVDANTNDAPAIQAALNACLATGGVVFLPRGKYQIKTTLKVPSNVTLAGAGMGLTTIYMPAASFTNTKFNKRIATSMGIDASGQLADQYNAAHNITIRDLTVESEVSDARCLYPIRASNVINLEIANVEVTGIPVGTLIELNSIRGSCAVHHCYLHDCRTAYSNYDQQPQTTGIEIDGNRVRLASDEVISSHGIDVHDNRIEDLVFTGAALGYGAQTDGVNVGVCTGIRVHDNYMRNVGEGIDLFASDCSIHSNILIDCYHAGVKLIHGASRNNVHHNLIVRPGRSGISLSGADTPGTGHNYINDNNIHDVNSSGVWSEPPMTNAGLHMIDGGDFPSNNNTFARNKITGGANMQYAVSNEHGAGNRFIDNEAELWPGRSYSRVSVTVNPLRPISAAITNVKKTLVRACAGSDQTISSVAGEVVVKYTTAQTNTQGEYNAATSVFTANSHRRIRVYATVRFSGVGSGEKYQLRIRKNGTEQVNKIQIAPLSNELMFDVSDTLEVEPGNTVDVTLQHNSPSSRIISGNSLLSYLRIEEVAG